MKSTKILGILGIAEGVNSQGTSTAAKTLPLTLTN
ncbi:MAG: hypothetical protein ACI828_000764 [Flavobacteriales bacterium]|jgi:hypothetical protein